MLHWIDFNEEEKLEDFVATKVNHRIISVKWPKPHSGHYWKKKLTAVQNVKSGKCMTNNGRK